MKKIGILCLVLLAQTAFATGYHHGYSKHKHNHHPHHPHGPQCGGTPVDTVVCSSDERIVNGDFEDDPVTAGQWQLFPELSGWEQKWVVAGTCNSGPLAELQMFSSEQISGSTQFIELDSDCLGSGPKTTNLEIKQFIDAKKGEKIKLEFFYKPRSLSYGTMALEVKFGQYTLNFSSFTTTQWQKFSQEFLVRTQDVVNGKMLVSFKDIGTPNTYGMFVDNVSAKATNCKPAEVLCTKAVEAVSYSPVGTIASNRKNPLMALGLPDAEPVVEPNVKFTSLGFGGSIVLKLDAPVKNVVGPDLRVWETTGGNDSYQQYKEEADVYGSMDGVQWTLLGRVKNDNNAPELGQVDLGTMEKALYIKIVDKSPVVSGRDGFDVDALTCVNQENEFDGEAYYLDKTYKKIYKVATENTNVFVKEFAPMPFSAAHLGKSQDSLVVIQSGGNKRIKEVNVDSLQLTDNYPMDFRGSLTQVAVNSDNTVIVNKAGTNQLYSQHLILGITQYLGKVYYQGKPLPLLGGDLAYDTNGDLYVATQFKGGQLFKLEKTCNCSNEGFNAILVAKNLGKVSGLAKIKNGEMLLSILNSKTMKAVKLSTGAVRTLNVSGDIQKQGHGADLAN